MDFGDSQIPIGPTSGGIPTLQILSKDATMTSLGAVTVQGIRGQTVKNAAATDAQILIYVGANTDWEQKSVSQDVSLAATGAATVVGLEGVALDAGTVGTPSDGEVITYVAAAGKYKAVAPSGGGGGAALVLTHLTGTTVNSLVTIYTKTATNSGQWIFGIKATTNDVGYLFTVTDAYGNSATISGPVNPATPYDVRIDRGTDISPTLAGPITKVVLEVQSFTSGSPAGYDIWAQSLA